VAHLASQPVPVRTVDLQIRIHLNHYYGGGTAMKGRSRLLSFGTVFATKNGKKAKSKKVKK